MPRDLKLPLGWRFSSFKKILLLRLRSCYKYGGRHVAIKQQRDVKRYHVTYHPATRDSAADSINGVSMKTFGSIMSSEPIVVLVLVEDVDTFLKRCGVVE